MEDVDTGKIEKELEKIPDDVRETFLIYLRYYALSLARESLKCEKVTDIKFRDGGFTVLRNLMKILNDTRKQPVKKLA